MIAPELIIGPPVRRPQIEVLEPRPVRRTPEHQPDEASRIVRGTGRHGARDPHLDRPITKRRLVEQRDFLESRGRISRQEPFGQLHRLAPLIAHRLRARSDQRETARPVEGNDDRSRLIGCSVRTTRRQQHHRPRGQYPPHRSHDSAGQRVSAEYATPSDQTPVGIVASTVRDATSIATTGFRPCNVTNAVFPSGVSVTPSGHGDPGTSAVGTRLSAAKVIRPSSARVAVLKKRTTAETGSVMIAVFPSDVIASRYGSPNPPIVSATMPDAGVTMLTTLSLSLPTQT